MIRRNKARNGKRKKKILKRNITTMNNDSKLRRQNMNLKDNNGHKNEQNIS